MPIDNRTANLNLPLPNVANPLIEDVQRLRDAFIALDTKIHAIDLLLSSDDLSLDSVQEMVNAIKADSAGLSALSSSVSSQLAAQNAAVALQLSNQTAAVNSALEAQSSSVNTALAAKQDTLTAADLAAARMFAKQNFGGF